MYQTGEVGVGNDEIMFTKAGYIYILRIQGRATLRFHQSLADQG